MTVGQHHKAARQAGPVGSSAGLQTPVGQAGGMVIRKTKQGGFLREYCNVLWLRHDTVCFVCDGSRGLGKLNLERGIMMPILFAITGTALADFASGAVLGAAVYLTSRGVRNQLRNRKK